MTRLKNDFYGNLNSYKKDSEEKVYSLKQDFDEVNKIMRTNYVDEFQKLKDEMRNRLDSTEVKLQKDFTKVIDDTTQAIEDSIN